MLFSLKFNFYPSFFIISPRPLDDDPFAVTSEPKRPLLESSISERAPNTSVPFKDKYSHSDRVPSATSQTPLGSAVDLFERRSGAQSDRVSHPVQEEQRSRKRKEMEAEIQIDELESIMSEDFDCFDEQPSDYKAQPIKQGLGNVEASSSSKRQRVQLEKNVTNKWSQVGLEKESTSHRNESEKSVKHIFSVKKELDNDLEYGSTYHESSKRPQASSASRSKNLDPFEDDEVSVLVFAHAARSRKEIKTELSQNTQIIYISGF